MTTHTLDSPTPHEPSQPAAQRALQGFRHWRKGRPFPAGLLIVLAGIAADLLLKWLKPSSARPNELRLFAFLVPLILFLFYFLDLMITRGILWSIHLWLGSCVMAGFVGLVLSYLLVAPRGPVDE